MAAISYSILVGGTLETVVASTNAPGAGTVEIRMDQTATTVNDQNPLSGAAITRAPKKGEIQALIRVLEEYLIRDTNVLE
jgi:hypothetical protein